MATESCKDQVYLCHHKFFLLNYYYQRFLFFGPLVLFVQIQSKSKLMGRGSRAIVWIEYYVYHIAVYHGCPPPPVPQGYSPDTQALSLPVKTNIAIFRFHLDNIFNKWHIIHDWPTCSHQGVYKGLQGFKGGSAASVWDLYTKIWFYQRS